MPKQEERLKGLENLDPDRDLAPQEEEAGRGKIKPARVDGNGYW